MARLMRRAALGELDENVREEERSQEGKPFDVEEACAAIDGKVESYQNILKEKMEERIAALRAELVALLAKFPQEVKSMPVAQYQKEYGGSLDQYLQQQQKREINASRSKDAEAGATVEAGDTEASQKCSTPTHPAEEVELGNTCRAEKEASDAGSCGTAAALDNDIKQSGKQAAGRRPRRKDAPAAGLETPSAATPGTIPAGLASSVARAPKAGEVVLSANGSPLGLYGDGHITPFAIGRFAGVTPVAGQPAQASVRMTRRAAAAAAASAGGATPQALAETPAFAGGTLRRSARCRKAPNSALKNGTPLQDGLGSTQESSRRTHDIALITVQTEAGDTITLAGPEDARHIRDELRPEARGQLQKIQKQLDALMASLV